MGDGCRSGTKAFVDMYSRRGKASSPLPYFVLVHLDIFVVIVYVVLVYVVVVIIIVMVLLLQKINTC